MTKSMAGRILTGILLILHGLAHTTAGYWATGFGPLGISTLFWLTATLGFAAAGFGIIGVNPLRLYWRGLVMVGALASLMLLGGWSHPWLIPGILLDLAFVTIAVLWRERLPKWTTPVARIGGGLSWAFLVYLALLIAGRPWYTRWGSTPEERRMPLTGDGGVAQPRYRIDHAVTIEAPADQIWPWLLQLGQDRGGFYTYDWLERAFGAQIRNADSIHPEWQDRDLGDRVLAVPPGYLGGVFGDTLGWQITALDHNRVMVLEDWGTFALRPIDERRTRLIIRTLGAAEPTPEAILFSPVGLLLFEPAHFIMERGMLLGIKARAERTARLGLAVTRTNGGL
jgi:hypothetical protein